MPPKFSKETGIRVIFPDSLDFQPRTSPCEAHCPAGNPIQKVHALLKENLAEEALAFLKARNPFPGITGRVCSRPCEQNCNRRHYDEAVSIRALERSAADRADLSRLSIPTKEKSSGKKLAIIGSGPAGMTCAYFSTLLGHNVTVFESSPILGGIPRMAIPQFRLPHDVVDKEMSHVLQLGVRVRTNTKVGRDVRFEDLRAEFDAILIAAGRWKEQCLALPDAELLISGLKFMRDVNLGWRGPVGDTVAIIGGGGVAFNCAFTAKRLGASTIHILCLEPDGAMCAFEEDLRQAQAEGFHILHSRMVSRVLVSDRKICGVEHSPISSFAFDEKGRLSLRLSGGSNEFLSADTVISAIGLMPDLDFLSQDLEIGISAAGMLEVNPDTLMTAIPGIFAAGDVLPGTSMVARAIGSGRRAAIGIDNYLQGSRRKTGRIRISGDGHVLKEERTDDQSPHVVTFEEIMNAEFFEKRERRAAHRLSQEVSMHSLEEIEAGLEDDSTAPEAARCLHCGQCTACGCCVENCPGLVLVLASNGPVVQYPDECWHCGCCRIACPSGAVYYEFPLNMLV